MAEILRIVLGDKGLAVGEFTLRPDSDSGWRPDILRVVWRERVVLIQGGPNLFRVICPNGDEYAGFQEWLSDEDRNILRKLASDLTGRIWPAGGQLLKSRVQTLGEKKVDQALGRLIVGVDTTLTRRNFWEAFPFVGERLANHFCPPIPN